MSGHAVPDEIRFMKFALATTDDGCWPWGGSRTASGYGYFFWSGRIGYAHRYAFRANYGPIPDGLTVHHICNNPSCVNPAHLVALSLQENISLAINGGGQRNKRKTHCKRGHEFTEANTASYKPGSRECRECNKQRAAKFYRDSREVEE